MLRRLDLFPSAREVPANTDIRSKGWHFSLCSQNQVPIVQKQPASCKVKIAKPAHSVGQKQRHSQEKLKGVAGDMLSAPPEKEIPSSISKAYRGKSLNWSTFERKPPRLSSQSVVRARVRSLTNTQ